MYYNGRIWGNFNFMSSMSRGQNGEIKMEQRAFRFPQVLRKVDPTSPLPFLGRTKFGGYRAF